MKSEQKIGLFGSMRTKLIVAITAVGILPIAVAIIISTINSTAIAKQSAEDLNEKKAEFVSSDLSSTLTANIRAMEQVAAAASTWDFVASPTDEAKLNTMVAQLQSVDANFGDNNSTVITGLDGENIARSKGNFTNIAEREYFKQASAGKTYISEMSISKTTGARIIVPAIPVKDGSGSVIAVLTRNYDLAYLHEILLNNATNGTTIYVMDRNGIVIATSEAELGPEDEISMEGTEVYNLAMASDEGSFIDTANGRKVTSYISEPLTGWVIVVATDYNAITAQSRHAMTVMIVIGVLLGIAAVIISIIFGTMIDKNITAIDGSLSALADGRFVSIDVGMDRKDEFGRIIRNTNSVIDKLRQVVSTIRSMAGEVESDSADVSETASQIAETMNDIAQAVQEVASGATQQADEIQQATESVGVISTNIDGVTDDATNLKDTAETMHEHSRSSQDELRELEKSSAHMAEAIERITQTISATNQAVDNISSKVDAIDSIASQTSLLALNASIEAARAGDAGRGFAVVAEEIGKLATDSAASANDIKEEMNKLLAQSQEAVRVAEDVAESNKAQYETIENTVGSIQNLISGINTTVDGVGHINGNASACNESKLVIVDAMNNLSAISEENAASTQQTSASMQELNATVDHLAHEASALKSHADILSDEMKFFKD